MLRHAFRLSCCAIFLTLGAALLFAGPDEDREKIVATLKVQKALAQGRERLQLGHFREAVEALESQLAQINGNRDYLNTLRDAYLGLIRELEQKNQSGEVASFRRRLESLDPGALLELKGPAAPTAPAGLLNPLSRPAEPAPGMTAATVPAPKAPAAATEVDPFSDANSTTANQARQQLEQAEKAFEVSKYDEACKLFEAANKTDANLAAPARERWAYCKMHVVVAALNRSGGSPQELEREVRLAMSMSPKLESFGKDLLRKIQQRQGTAGLEREEAVGAAEVRHSQGQGWAIAETTNFRIFHNQKPEYGEKAARAAESARVAAARKWFGDVPPTWMPRCDLYLHQTRDDYSKATGQPADCPGHSTIEHDKKDAEKVVTRRIDLHIDDPNVLFGVLPHETTHVVLAGRFPRPLPRWADEGMAVLSEPRERVERHLRNLPQHQRERQLFAVADLMQFEEYPEGRYIGSFYAQSVSLVDYMVSLKGPQEFTQFVRDGMRGGYEPALQQHYGVRGFVELQRRWQGAALSGQKAVAQQGR